MIKAPPRSAGKPGAAAIGPGSQSQSTESVGHHSCPRGKDDPLRLAVVLVPPLSSLGLGGLGPPVLAPWVRVVATFAPARGMRGTAVRMGARPSLGVLGVDFLLLLAGRLPLLACVRLKRTHRFVRPPEEHVVVSFPDLQDVEGVLVRDIAAFYGDGLFHPLDKVGLVDCSADFSLEDVV